MAYAYNAISQAASRTTAYLTSPELQSTAQALATYLVASAISHKLNLEKKTVALEIHPLQSLYSHLETSLQRQEQIPDLQQRLNAVPAKLRQAILLEMGSPATQGSESRLLHVIKRVVEKTLDDQQTTRKNGIFGTVYRMAGQPQTNDLEWGEHHAKDDTLRLIRALHRHHCLEISGKQITVYSDLEKGLSQPSCRFHLYRREPNRGSIGYHNGISTTFDLAKSNAARLSDQCCQGHNIHGTYSATVNTQWDLISATLGQGTTSTPGVLQLLDRWQDFFEENPTGHLLQICHSRGAIEVNNALTQLPREKQQRIIVIAVAPACFIPTSSAKKVVNLVIPSDPVPKVALNRHLPNPNTMVLGEHSDGQNSHFLLGPSYLTALAPLVDQYLRTNEV
jgi:hypothetical protein